MATRRKLDLNALAEVEGTKTKVTVESAEDVEDKILRLHQEKLSFWFKNLGPFVLAGLIITIVMICCLVILIRPDSASTDRDNAWKAIAGLLGVVFGTVFGKATAKSSE